MENALPVLCILFTMMFFILGILVKITLSFKKELREDLREVKALFFIHKHRENGQAFIPQKLTAKNPEKNKETTHDIPRR